MAEDEAEQENNNSGMLDKIKSTYSRAYSTRNTPAPAAEKLIKETVSNSYLSSIFLKYSPFTSHQILLKFPSFFALNPAPSFIEAQQSSDRSITAVNLDRVGNNFQHA